MIYHLVKNCHLGKEALWLAQDSSALQVWASASRLIKDDSPGLSLKKVK